MPDSTVKQWLEHPVGGALLRDLLAQSGRKESALRPVRRFPLSRLAAMSRGLLTDDVIAQLVTQANSGQVTPAAPVAPDALIARQDDAGEAAAVSAETADWQERIVPDRFAGKTVIVTGAASGIGRATASRVAREGGRVVAVDLSEDGLTQLADSLPGADVVPVRADVTNAEDIARIVAAAGQTVDALANVAGVPDDMTPAHEASDAIWQRCFAVNVDGPFKLSRGVIPQMLTAGRGSIVNVASEAALRGGAAGVSYTASKHAVIGLTKNLAFMYGPSGIRANVVAPGGVLTNIDVRYNSDLGSERLGETLALIPAPVEPHALAASITFLLSDDGVNINGAVLPSDGGWSAY